VKLKVDRKGISFVENWKMALTFSRCNQSANIKISQVEVKVEEGSDSIILPCKTKQNIPEATRVEWTRSDLGLMVVREYSNQSGQLMTQDEVYRDQTKMNEDLLRTGDLNLSLTLKQPTVDDSGEYKCLVWRKGNLIRKKTVSDFAHVVFVVLSVSQVQFLMRAESVQLPFITTQNLPKDAEVRWIREESGPSVMVHVYKKPSDQPKEEDQVYKDQTEMKEDPLKTGETVGGRETSSDKNGRFVYLLFIGLCYCV
uniref:Ig-like domain-containing protein n=1 Tax=Maylandia zebra TaxID=106582 RepID=A0A3P9B7Z5_9CICH